MNLLAIFPCKFGPAVGCTPNLKVAAVPSAEECLLPHHAAFSSVPGCYNSLTLQVALIMNGYVAIPPALDRYLDEWDAADVLVLHWFDPRQIAWSIVACWWYRTRRPNARIILWGRHTSYGRDASRDLSLFSADRFLPRIFDIITCRADEEALVAGLRCLGEESSDEKGLLMSDGFEFKFSGHADAPANHRLRETVGVGLPSRERLAPARVCWQAENRIELIEGIARLRLWSAVERGGTWRTPGHYPWMTSREKRELHAHLSTFPQWEECAPHDYCPLRPLDELPDMMPSPVERIV